MEKEFLKMAYERMMRIRTFDMWMHEAIKEGREPFVGIMHSHIGEEGYAAAVITQLRDDDYLSTTYRNHAHSLARGVDLNGFAAEVCGKKTGLCGGRAGNMHLVDQNLNIIGGFGIIGAGLPATVGSALASKYKKTDQVSVGFFGDGAVAQGAVHESLNLASTFGLPVLFCNNNNHYAMSTSAEYNLAAKSTTEYAKAHQIPCETCCGMDFFKAYEAAKKAIAYIRETGKPYYIEFDCFRYHGQWEGDPQNYKDKEQTAYYMDRDPIKLFREGAVARGLLTIEELDEIDASVEKQVEDSISYALSCEAPGMEDIMTDIYADAY